VLMHTIMSYYLTMGILANLNVSSKQFCERQLWRQYQTNYKSQPT
jgi:hypothetical protein